MTNVIALPIRRLTFEAVDIDVAAALAKYDDAKACAAAAFVLLKMSPQEMKESVAEMALKSSEGDDLLSELVSEVENYAKDFDALSHLFSCVAARLTAVHHRLI